MEFTNVAELKALLADLPDDALVGTFHQGIGKPRVGNLVPMAINSQGYRVKWLIEGEELAEGETLGYGIV